MDRGAIFTEGVEAYALGFGRDECPFPASSAERLVWQDGWDEAKLADPDNSAESTL